MEILKRIDNIYAIDVIVGPMLAHKAEDEGAVAENIAGQSGHVSMIPFKYLYYTRSRCYWKNRGTIEKDEYRL